MTTPPAQPPTPPPASPSSGLPADSIEVVLTVPPNLHLPEHLRRTMEELERELRQYDLPPQEELDCWINIRCQLRIG
jgi:hypothetical protein